MSEYPWNEKNNTFTWLSSLYNPFNIVLLETFYNCRHLSDHNTRVLNTRGWVGGGSEKFKFINKRGGGVLLNRGGRKI